MRVCLVLAVLLMTVLNGCELAKPPPTPVGGGGLQPPPGITGCYSLPPGQVKACIDGLVPTPVPAKPSIALSSGLGDLPAQLANTDAYIANWLCNDEIDATDLVALNPSQLSYLFANVPASRLSNIMSLVGQSSGNPWTYYWSLYAMARYNGLTPTGY